MRREFPLRGLVLAGVCCCDKERTRTLQQLFNNLAATRFSVPRDNLGIPEGHQCCLPVGMWASKVAISSEDTPIRGLSLTSCSYLLDIYCRYQAQGRPEHATKLSTLARILHQHIENISDTRRVSVCRLMCPRHMQRFTSFFAHVSIRSWMITWGI